MQYLKRYYLNNNGKGPIDFNDFDIRITNKHDDRYLKFKKIYNVAAVLFEHRPLVELKFILQHYHDVLPIDVSLHVFHSIYNLDKLPKLNSYALHNNIKRNITYTDTGFGNISRSFYNNYMKSHKFWKDDLKDYDYVLLFQTDTLICNEKKYENEKYIASLFQYDYIGAPWLDETKTWNPQRLKLHPNRPQGFPCACLQDRTIPKLYTTVGNGGLSWRNRNAMIQVIDRFKNNDKPFNEDLWFACGCLAMNLQLANESVASKFAIESLKDGYKIKQTPFGLHKTWEYVDNLVERLGGSQNCKALETLMNILKANNEAKQEL